MANRYIPERGVYAIRCVDGRAYVGASADIRQRWSEHRSMLRRGRHSNRLLQDARDALGDGALVFEVLELVPNDDLSDAEQRWIDRLVAYGDGFNLCPLAASAAGVIRTADVCARNSQIQRGRKAKPETRAKMSAVRTGKTHSAATRAQLAAQRLGEKGTMAKLREAEVLAIRQMSAAGVVQHVIAARFGVSQMAVSKAVRRVTWAHLP